jgi:hypothetical protein
MPNNVRTQADGVWVDGYTPSKADWEDLERKIFGSWNGDRGGAYCAPLGAAGGPYIISGDGLTVTSKVRLTYGGAIYGGSGAFVIRDGAWPQLSSTHPARTRSIVQTIDAFMTNKRYLWSRNHPYAGVGSVALAAKTTYGRQIETADLYVPLRVVDGALLTKVSLHFRVASKRRFAPLEMPKLQILRVPRDSQTNTPQPLRKTTDGLGFFSPPLVTSGDAWYNDGNPQSFDYVCDQNNIIDVANYSYVARIVEERGALTPDDEFDGIRLVERKTDVLMVGTNALTLNGNQIADGVASGTGGARILIVDTDAQIETGLTVADSAKNGIWTAAAGAWVRAGDLDEQSDFTPNFIVKATSGGINAEAVWQCQHPANTTRVDLGTGAASDTKTQPRFVPAEPKGNIYHSLVPTFEVSDLRFQ